MITVRDLVRNRLGASETGLDRPGPIGADLDRLWRYLLAAHPNHTIQWGYFRRLVREWQREMETFRRLAKGRPFDNEPPASQR